ncbi:microtubule-associated protein 70-5 [Dorcoceras hygrometricum]|uniref:Microtubule-associated protein 70-5 n=1 Tax=Dorcoceras hygrometricum TaxID=472368 RepID=A0A2Z7DK67_9LAMI|nr:microtubule-associated protein 70-5 [Dorcoceras hygrometricum]
MASWTYEESAVTSHPAGTLNQQMLFAMVCPAGSYSAISRELLKLAIAKRCRLNKLIRQRFAFALKIQQMRNDGVLDLRRISSDITSSRNAKSADALCDAFCLRAKDSADGLAMIKPACTSSKNDQLAATVHPDTTALLGNPVSSISRPTTGQPAASTSRRNQQYIQTRATIDQLLICIQSQDDVPFASTSRSTSGQPVAAMKRKTRCKVNCKGATTRRRKETAVARSVVTKKRQQLSEQLLNNLLENIQPFNAINAQYGKNQWLRLSHANCLNLREQDF